MISSLELARICGVSQGTVDRALHGRAGINPKTKEKILRVANRYGYRPHPATMELLSGRSRTIVALVQTLNSIFFMDLLNAIRAGLATEGYRFLLCPVSDAEEMLEMLRDFSARRSPAAVVIPPEDNIVIPGPLGKSIRVVSLLSPCRGKETVFVTAAEERTGRDAVAYLASRGHRTILHLTYTRAAYAVKARARGYRAEMQKRGLKPFVLAENREHKLLETVKATGATALFCHNDWLALSAMRILARSGLRVPRDVSVLGVDNSPTFVDLYDDITTLAYPVAWTAEQVLRVVRGKAPARRAPRFELVERRTVRDA
ncbi:MAG: LacI family DNA-binding transcriptional regulator [Kiritimatiellae bacterium]|nr:LacI family DNA-binding transcriptional regulator [Kiritimatiellia bacterium]